MMATTLHLPPIQAVGGHHDFVKELCPASVVHMPIGPVEDWWDKIPVEWTIVTSEFGTEERGGAGKVSKSTWISAHNRK